MLFRSPAPNRINVALIMAAPAGDGNRRPPIPSSRPVNADSPAWTASGHRPTGSLEVAVRFGGKGTALCPLVPGPRSPPPAAGPGQATILYLLGLNHVRLTFRHNGRNESLTENSGDVFEPALA